MRKQQKENNRKPSLLSGITLSLVTTVLCLLGIESALKYYLAPPAYQWDRRLMFFSEGSVFKNQQWGGFVYQPNARIHSQTFYITDPNVPKLVREYSYEIRTNSTGLVQLADIVASQPSILFLGDSYTEGQGARPWFYRLEAQWPKQAQYQIINGGILGAGFQAWEHLYKDISKITEISKIVIIFISDDWIRPIWRFSEHDLECLKSAAQCTGSDNFFGLPEHPVEMDVQIHRIARARVDYLARRTSALNIVKRSVIYQRLLLPAYHRWWPYRRAEEERQFEESKKALLNIVKKIGPQNLLFIQLPQKNELDSGPGFMGGKGREFIRRQGFSFVDGFEKCGLKMTDFHLHDGHPNVKGYMKVAECVNGSVREAFRPL